VAFVGGLDLCWGRYDTSSHELIEQFNEKKIYKWPGIDYSNVRIEDFEYVKNFNEELIDRNFQPRMPWHDVQILLEGPVVYDLCRHFVERWNFSINSVVFKNPKKKTIIRGKLSNYLFYKYFNK
jgi:phospholipase D1/2